MEYVSVHDIEIPALGLGTYKLRGDPCQHVVQEALSLGYRHLDTAEMYGNHDAIGRAIESSPVVRDEIFLTTKVWRTNLKHTQVLQAVEDSLRSLRTEYIDLLLIHWPNRNVPITETIDAMNQLQHDGQVRLIGVSNFSVSQLADAREASATPIITDQVEYHPLNRQDDLLEYCLANDIMLTAYSPLAEGQLTTHDELSAIGNEHGKTAAQVALRWLIQQDGVAAIPKAASRDHLHENIDIFDFSLSAEEMHRIFDVRDGLLSHLRTRLGL